MTKTAAAAFACVALAAGCGDTQSTSAPGEEDESAGSGFSDDRLASSDVAQVQRAMEKITTDCEGATKGDVHVLVTVHRQAPDAIYDSGNIDRDMSVTTILESKRDELAECGNDEVAAVLDRELAEG